MMPDYVYLLMNVSSKYSIVQFKILKGKSVVMLVVVLFEKHENQKCKFGS